MLASAGEDGTVRLHDTDTGRLRQLLQLGPIRGLVNGVAFTPDGRHLATANANGTVYILRLPPEGRMIGATDLPAIAPMSLNSGGPLPTGFTKSIGMEFTELFNERDSRGSLPEQRGKPWFVVDRVLGNESGGGSIFTKKTYTNFDLRMEFQIAEDAATSVDIWSYPGDTPVWVFLENTRNAMGAITFDAKEKGFNVRRLNPPAELRPEGQWNELRIEVNDCDLSVSLNGRALDKVNIRAHVDGRRMELPPANRLMGRIGLTKRWGTGKILIRKLSIEDLRRKERSWRSRVPRTTAERTRRDSTGGGKTGGLEFPRRSPHGPRSMGRSRQRLLQGH